MKITSGIARGHKLKVPKVTDLRPTQNMVRLAIFSILNKIVKNADVLDLYAGTGSLGIEALSQGAKNADFIDISKSACQAIKENLNHSRLLGKAKIFHKDANEFIQNTPDRQYTLIFLSPPYAKMQTIKLEPLSRILKRGGVVVYLHTKGAKLPQNDTLMHKETRAYGGEEISFFTRN